MVARVKYPKFDVFGKVVIGDRVYIGTNSINNARCVDM